MTITRLTDGTFVADVTSLVHAYQALLVRDQKVRAGKVRSAAKTAAARLNGAKGGRPRTTQQ